MKPKYYGVYNHKGLSVPLWERTNYYDSSGQVVRAIQVLQESFEWKWLEYKVYNDDGELIYQGEM